jgi:hypothetical protein
MLKALSLVCTVKGMGLTEMRRELLSLSLKTVLVLLVK